MSARHARRHARQLFRGTARLKAAVGDRITIGVGAPNRPTRDGVILEVQNGDGSPPYVVQWSDDGERALLYPGGDVSIDRVAHSR